MQASGPTPDQPYPDRETPRAVRLREIALRLWEAREVHVEAWDHPNYRVRGKNFIFAAADGSGISVKLPKPEAEWVVANVPDAQPTGYGLGRHGWVSVTTPAAGDDEGWSQISEWIRESFRLVAPKRLAALLEDSDQG